MGECSKKGLPIIRDVVMEVESRWQRAMEAEIKGG